jgi:hypothetical protein
LLVLRFLEKKRAACQNVVRYKKSLRKDRWLNKISSLFVRTKFAKRWFVEQNFLLHNVC